MLGNIFILGDSYSTFKGYIPDGYDAYYRDNGPEYVIYNEDVELCDKDVCKVEQTWWYDIVNEMGTLIRNCSWSGSTICHTGYSGKDYRYRSFVTRIQKLIHENYFKENKVDTIFVFGGTNDSWADAPLGEDIKSGWTTDDLYKVFPAFRCLINMLVSENPDAKIYCIINTGLKPEISNFYKSVCRENNVEIVELHDIDKVYGHPTIKGMKEIKDQVINHIKSK